VWVKWLLALPHYVIIAFFVGGGSYVVYRTGRRSRPLRRSCSRRIAAPIIPTQRR
jgi:hypothetical protein